MEDVASRKERRYCDKECREKSFDLHDDFFSIQNNTFVVNDSLQDDTQTMNKRNHSLRRPPVCLNDHVLTSLNISLDVNKNIVIFQNGNLDAKLLTLQNNNLDLSNLVLGFQKGNLDMSNYVLNL